MQKRLTVLTCKTFHKELLLDLSVVLNSLIKLIKVPCHVYVNPAAMLLKHVNSLLTFDAGRPRG